MRLSAEQRNHFDTFGFLAFPQLLSADETQALAASFDDGFRPGAEQRCFDTEVAEGSPPTTRQYAGMMSASTPFFASLADDHRFADVAEQLIGGAVLPIAVDGNRHVDDTSWHADIQPGASYRAVKFCIYPDRLTGSTGALRLVPGSNSGALHEQLEAANLRTTTEAGDTALGVPGSELPHFAFESEPGDVLVFNVSCFHAAFGGAPGRRQGVIVYYEDPQTPRARKDIAEQMAGNHSAYSKHGTVMYPEFWRTELSRRNERHRGWIERMAELGLLDPPPPPPPEDASARL